MNDSPSSATDPAQQPDDIPVHEVSVPEALELAKGLQRRNQLAEAEEIYLAVLSQLPTEGNALNFLGVLRHQQGRNEEALGLIALAIDNLPGVAGPWLNLANVLLESGYYDDAAKALQQVIELEPDLVLAYNNLGVLHTRQERWELAEQCFKQAIERDPKIDYLHFNLANLCFKTGRFRESSEHGMRSLGLEPGNSAARGLLSLALFHAGENERAIKNLQEWAEDEPDDPRPRHHLAAAGVGETPARASDGYVEKVFDSFAASFDAKLESLGYRAPSLVCDALVAMGSRLPRGGVILDAGCGTGLCGPMLRPLGSRLEGVDLSSGMLARAQLRGGYDELHHAEMTDFMRRSPDRFDIVACADALIYFGDLDELMAALAQAMRAGAVFAASTEVLADDEGDYSLALHGRYSHSAAYLRRTLPRHGLRLTSIEQHVLRNEGGKPVEGWVFTAQR